MRPDLNKGIFLCAASGMIVATLS